MWVIRRARLIWVKFKRSTTFSTKVGLMKAQTVKNMIDYGFKYFKLEL